MVWASLKGLCVGGGGGTCTTAPPAPSGSTPVYQYIVVPVPRVSHLTMSTGTVHLYFSFKNLFLNNHN